MIITIKCLNKIISYNTYAIFYEIGGILGGKNNRITHIKLDKGGSSNCRTSYVPDTDKLNKVIIGWKKQDIDFYGIFHSHLDTSEQLSLADKQYIKAIMLAMPDEVDHLYFPLVLPKCGKLIAFKAIRRDKQVDIIKDDVEII